MADAYPCRDAIQVSQDEQEQGATLSSGKWSERSNHEGFFVTTDLSEKELEDVLESDNKNNFDKYLTQENISQMQVISFSSCRLKRIPPTLCNFTHITRLYFAYNELSTLPKEFSMLENLTNLNLQTNRFSEIPDALCKLRKLKILSLQRNNITNEGLKNINQVNQLVELYLSSNRLKHQLPLSVCKLPCLMLLDVKNNLIERLPNEIANLTELRVLYVRGNCLKRLPDDIGKLQHLQLACFAENCIDSVKFGAFVRLRELKDLCLYSNRLENKEELEKYISIFKTKGILLRLAESRVVVSQQITCDSPYKFSQHDVTFIYDGSDAVAQWVRRAVGYLENHGITSTIRTHLDSSIDIQKDVRYSEVVIPIFTQSFHEMVDKDNPAGENIRVALGEIEKHLGNFLVVFYEKDCSISCRWFAANSMSIQTEPGSENGNGNGYNGSHDDQYEFKNLLEQIMEIRGDRISKVIEYH